MITINNWFGLGYNMVNCTSNLQLLVEPRLLIAIHRLAIPMLLKKSGGTAVNFRHCHFDIYQNQLMLISLSYINDSRHSRFIVSHTQEVNTT